MQRDSDTEGDTEPEETKKREDKGKEKLAAGGDEDEDTEEDEKDEVEVVLAAIAEAQRRRMHPNNAVGGEEEVRVMGGVDGEGEQQQQQRRRHRRLRRFPSFEGLGRRAFACVRHLLLDANHLPSIPDGTYAFVFTLNTHVTAHCLCHTHTRSTEAYIVWFYFG